MSHHCHAHNCTKEVPPKLLMCARHWRMVPVKLQSLVWSTYRPRQEIDKQPSPEYLLVQRSAVWSVFVDEGGCKWTDVPKVGTQAYMIGPASLNAQPAPSDEYVMQERIAIKMDSGIPEDESIRQATEEFAPRQRMLS